MDYFQHLTHVELGAAVTVASLVPTVLAIKFLFRSKGPIPPGPPGLPFFGNIFQLPAKGQYLKFTEWKEKYGPIFSLNLMGQLVVVLNTHKVAADLLDRRSLIYSDRPRFIMYGLRADVSFRSMHKSRVYEYLSGGLLISGAPYGEFKWLLGGAISPCSINPFSAMYAAAMDTGQDENRALPEHEECLRSSLNQHVRANFVAKARTWVISTSEESGKRKMKAFNSAAEHGIALGGSGGLKDCGDIENCRVENNLAAGTISELYNLTRRKSRGWGDGLIFAGTDPSRFEETCATDHVGLRGTKAVRVGKFCRHTDEAAMNHWYKRGQRLKTRWTAVGKNTAKGRTKGVRWRGCAEKEEKSKNIWGNSTAEEPFA
ncbi:hypothetical protein B0H14DRAFT_2580827 [Mycena olivaceomarginata]|nr:hypothetical protein B0H14DRAFT_2580827 [Mycena olivaceomarginata]